MVDNDGIPEHRDCELLGFIVLFCCRSVEGIREARHKGGLRVPPILESLSWFFNEDKDSRLSPVLFLESIY